MALHKCSTCGFVADFQDFVVDYVWSDEDDDEIAVLKCPQCGEDDENKIEEI